MKQSPEEIAEINNEFYTRVLSGEQGAPRIVKQDVFYMEKTTCLLYNVSMS